MIIMHDLDWQFGISNLAGDFNMNFFAWDWRICSKNWFFQKIEIRKIGDIFAINYSEKIPDHQSSSKNPVVSKNWHSNYRGSTVYIYVTRHAKTCLMGTYVNNELWRFKSSRFTATSLTFNWHKCVTNCKSVLFNSDYFQFPIIVKPFIF